MEWYVVNTFSGYENSVKKALEDRIKNAGLEEQFGEILIPSEKVTTRSGKKTVQKTNKLLPGYIFISMDLTKASWHLVQNTPKVTGFLGGQNPKPVRKAEMNRMLGQAPPDEQAPVEKVVPNITYSVGQQVRVRSGAFANFTGEVEEINNDKQKIWLSVSLFGRPTRVEVDFSEVEPVV
ncbi:MULTISPECIES: transcription termination/antitermination protein NusG [Nannocystis]|jgi:transcription termination/antitermination protein NusG|uniref:Transcription termination/antitermination protein NusG n=7 Tax=Nannocystis TaxID=53 RepID=A0ABS7TSL5_9BACT|nr:MULTISPECIES: transcription termination/antitermination protein NusG [Nannocystis]MBZ5711208.1 transcription termination/antitermination protein NusG [Nannocystis pusilla]MCY1012126.1 transcription termination/antitermination protein NusG [Nannocystis pusilla]MCY1056128.1 transcription termination/antitermination protein NusG [Nannocystis sp. SCPEA4]MCY1066844.1 transcription termination/antitermination protein NusG [Nannocystis sp. RBIL2]MDC0668986.1 transcription termination/antiterminati